MIWSPPTEYIAPYGVFGIPIRMTFEYWLAGVADMPAILPGGKKSAGGDPSQLCKALTVLRL
jgi:hypothetical protein